MRAGHDLVDRGQGGDDLFERGAEGGDEFFSEHDFLQIWGLFLRTFSRQRTIKDTTKTSICQPCQHSVRLW